MSPYYYVERSSNTNEKGYVDSAFLSSTEISGSGGSGSGSQPWASRYGTTVWKKESHQNSSYDGVKNIQTDLRKVGYTSITKADGYYGPITETAVKNFQGNWGLTKDGICGNNTKQKLWDHPDR